MDEIILTEQQKRCIPDVTFELIPIRNLVSNQAYQRPLSEGHIRSAVEEFDVYQINPVKVSRRDGINYVFDGQHTIEIVASESGSRDTPVWIPGQIAGTKNCWKKERTVIWKRSKKILSREIIRICTEKLHRLDRQQMLFTWILRI